VSNSLANLQVNLVRSNKRKTLGLQVKKGEVVVRAPFYLDESTIAHFVQSKLPWVKKKLAQHELLVEQQAKYKIAHNGILLFLGEEKRLLVSFGDKANLRVDDQILSCTLPQSSLSNTDNPTDHSITQAKLNRLVNNFYKAQANLLLTEKVNEWQRTIGSYAQELVIRKYKSRWGSCSAQGKISLNYLLMACPEFVIDYVVVHELCHLTHLNHSASFWTKVSNHFPRYQQAKAWLRFNQHKIIF